MGDVKVVFVGHVCIDRNVTEGSTYTSWGSPALFMTRYIRETLGVTPTIITTYGEDFADYAQGVHLYPQEPTSRPTLAYENIINDGKRTQYCHNHSHSFLPSVNEDVKSLIRSADIVFFAPLTPFIEPEYIAEIMQHTSKSCLRVLLPQGFMRDINESGLVRPRDFVEAQRILPYFDLVILSDEDQPNAFDKAHDWQKLSPDTKLVITQNAKGASVIHSGSAIHIPTIPVPDAMIVDSVGCGDVFSAAAAYHFYASGDLRSSIEKGHEAARKKLLSRRA